MENDDLFEIYITNGCCEYVTLVVGNEEVDHMLNVIRYTAGLQTITIHCIEPELQHFLSNCYSMNAVIEG